MARPRIELQEILTGLAPNVYFQPPNNLKIKYPCIIYARDTVVVSFADNKPYQDSKKYTVTVIDVNPDSQIPEKVRLLPYCEHDRFFTKDDLNHDVFTLHF